MTDSASHTSAPPRRLALLFVLFAAVALLYAVQEEPMGIEDAADAGRPVARHARGTVDVQAQRAAAERDSTERALGQQVAALWRSDTRWVVTPGSDSVAALTEAEVGDSAAVDVLGAFVSLRALRDSSGAVELLGGAEAGRAVLGDNPDSLVRDGLRGREGCPIALPLRLRRTAGGADWSIGVVPGMLQFVPPSDSGAAYRAEARRLLDALPDSTLSWPTVPESLKGVPWPEPDVRVWRNDGLEILVASRARFSDTSAAPNYTHEQEIVAERPLGTRAAFTAVLPWNSAYYADERASSGIGPAVRIGPARRFGFLSWSEGEEGHGGAIIARVGGGWKSVVTWYSGC